MPSKSKQLLNDPDFNSIDYREKRMLLESAIKQDMQQQGIESEFDKDQINEVMDKLIGSTQEKEYGEVSQGLSVPRKAALDITEKYVEPAVLGLAGGFGSTAGATSPIPGGAAIGGTLAYAGAKQGTDYLKDLISGQGRRSLKEELLTKPAKNIQEGMIQEIFGAAPVKLLEKMLAPNASRYATQKIMSNEGKLIDVPSVNNKTLVSEAQKRGIQYTPSDISGTKTMALVESLLEKIPRSSDVIRDFRLKAQLEPMLTSLETLKRENPTDNTIDELGQKIWGQINKYLKETTTYSDDQLNMFRDQVLEQIGSGKPSWLLGEEAQSILKGKAKNARELVSDKYKLVGESLPESKMETPALNKLSEKLISELNDAAKPDANVKAFANWYRKGIGEKVPKDLEALLESSSPEARSEVLKSFGYELQGKTPKQIESYIQDINSILKKEDALLGKAGKFTELTKEGGQLAQLKNAAREDLESLAQTNPESLRLLNDAKKSHGEYADTYKTDDIRKLIKSKPEKLIETVITKDGVRGVQNAKIAVGADGFEKIKQGFTNNIMGVGKHDVWKPEYLNSQLQKYGDEVLTEVYGKDGLTNLKQIAKDGLDLSIQKPGMATIRSLAKEYPDTIVDSLIGLPEKTSLTSKTLYKNMRAVKDVLNEKEFSALGDKLLDKIIKPEEVSGYISPAKFASKIEKYGDRLKAIYPEEKVDELIQFAKIARDMSKASRLADNPSGTGQVLIQYGLVNLAMSLPGANTAKKILAGTILFVPKEVAKFYISPAGRKFLTEGYKIPENVSEAMKLSTKLSKIIGYDSRQETNK